MFNPFDESTVSDATDTVLVSAKGGQESALEELIRRHQAWTTSPSVWFGTRATPRT